MLSKQSVGYEDPAKGPNHCSQCVHFDGRSRCDIVSGVIDPGAWCERFRMKEKMVKIAGRQYRAGVGDYTTANPAAKDKFGAKVKQASPDTTKEHQVVYSRTTGRPHEISFGPLPGNLVPSNPFASESQRSYLNMHPEKLGAKGLAEWNRASKGLTLPKHVKKSK